MGEKLPSTNVRYFKKNTKKHKRLGYERLMGGYKINETQKMAHLSLQGHNSKRSVINSDRKEPGLGLGQGRVGTTVRKFRVLRYHPETSAKLSGKFHCV